MLISKIMIAAGQAIPGPDPEQSGRDCAPGPAGDQRRASCRGVYGRGDIFGMSPKRPSTGSRPWSSIICSVAGQAILRSRIAFGVELAIIVGEIIVVAGQAILRISDAWC